MSNAPLVYLVSFISENYLHESGRATFPPIGLLYLAGALRNAGFDPRIFHLLGTQRGEFEALLESQPPGFIGISALTDQTLLPALRVSQHARKMGIPVVWGGVHATMLPELTLMDAADYVVMGEGEESFPELAKAIINREEPGEIHGVVRLTKGEVIFGPKPKPVDELDLFLPAWDLIDISKYNIPTPVGGLMSIILSRGCPYRCSFCYNEISRGGRWRSHSLDYFAETLDLWQKKTPFKVVTLEDDFLFESANKGAPWVEVLASRGLKWMASFRSNSITPDFARWLDENGCAAVCIGMESGDPEILESLNKKIRVEDHYNAAHALAETSIRASVGFVLNWPGETRESSVATLKLIDDLSRINARMRFNVGYYRPLPGTPCFGEAMNEGFVEPATTEEWGGIYDHPYGHRGFKQKEIEAIQVISGRLYTLYLKPWPLQKLIEPVMRWRWRNGKFRWFAVGAIRRWIKKITGARATHVFGPSIEKSD